MEDEGKGGGFCLCLKQRAGFIDAFRRRKEKPATCWGLALTALASLALLGYAIYLLIGTLNPDPITTTNIKWTIFTAFTMPLRCMYPSGCYVSTVYSGSSADSAWCAKNIFNVQSYAGCQTMSNGQLATINMCFSAYPTDGVMVMALNDSTVLTPAATRSATLLGPLEAVVAFGTSLVSLVRTTNNTNDPQYGSQRQEWYPLFVGAAVSLTSTHTSACGLSGQSVNAASLKFLPSFTDVSVDQTQDWGAFFAALGGAQSLIFVVVANFMVVRSLWHWAKGRGYACCGTAPEHNHRGTPVANATPRVYPHTDDGGADSPHSQSKFNLQLSSTPELSRSHEGVVDSEAHPGVKYV